MICGRMHLLSVQEEQRSLTLIRTHTQFEVQLQTCRLWHAGPQSEIVGLEDV